MLSQTGKAAKTIFVGLLLIASAVSNAQNTKEQVTIIGKFQPSLKEATKMNVMPELTSNPMQAGNHPLSRVETNVAVTIDPEPISPVQINLNEKKNLYRNHLNLGIGSNISPVFDFLHHSELSKTVALNVQTSHRSAWTNVRDYAPSAWMNNKASISTDINLREQVVQAGLGYGFDQFHWYGFKPSAYPSFDGNSKALLQQFNLFSARVLWKTKFRDPESVNHHLGLNLDFFNDRFMSIEHAYTLRGGARKNLNLLSFDGIQYVQIDAGLSYIVEADSTMEKSTLIINARPATGLKGSFYALEAGLGISSAQAERTYFHLLPDLSGNLYVFQERMSIFASFGGRLEHHNRLSLISENPFIRSTDSSFITVIPIAFQAGIKGNPLKGLELRFAVEHMTAEQMAFFTIDSTSTYNHQYTTVFDDVVRNRFTAEIRFDSRNNGRAELVGHFDRYEMNSLSKPWHKPSFQLYFNSWYPLSEKVQLKAGMMLLSGRYAPAPGNKISKLKDVTDIQLGGEYRYNEQLWMYATAANVLNQRYHRFDGYPVQGAQLIAGIKLNF